MKKNIAATVIITLITFQFNILAQTTGPESGSLLIIGGNAKDTLFIHLFKELAGGDNAEIVIIPTARNDESIEKDSQHTDQCGL